MEQSTELPPELRGEQPRKQSAQPPPGQSVERLGPRRSGLSAGKSSEQQREPQSTQLAE